MAIASAYAASTASRPANAATSMSSVERGRWKFVTRPLTTRNGSPGSSMRSVWASPIATSPPLARAGLAASGLDVRRQRYLTELVQPLQQGPRATQLEPYQHLSLGPPVDHGRAHLVAKWKAQIPATPESARQGFPDLRRPVLGLR